jgi:hypothetical protein
MLTAVFGIVALVLFVVLIRRAVFQASNRGNVPDAQALEDAVVALTPADRALIAALRNTHAPQMPPELFVRIALATSIATKQELAALSEPLVLVEFLDSLNLVEYIILIEQLATLSVSDDDASSFMTFEGVTKYVQHRLADRGKLY